MADSATCFGALNGSSDIEIHDAHLRLSIIGQKALAFGGYSEDTSIAITDSDVKIELKSADGKPTFAPDSSISVLNSRFRLIVNGNEIEKPVTINYT